MSKVNDSPQVTGQVTGQGIGKDEAVAFGHVVRWLQNHHLGWLASFLSKITGIPLEGREVVLENPRGPSASSSQPTPTPTPQPLPEHTVAVDPPSPERPSLEGGETPEASGNSGADNPTAPKSNAAPVIAPSTTSSAPLEDATMPEKVTNMTNTTPPSAILTDVIRNIGLTDAKLRAINLGEAREVWQTITNEVAVDCFAPNGKIDDAKLETWIDFLGNAETFKEEPLCFTPHVEFMRSQMHRICEDLRNNRNGIREQLNDAAGIAPGTHGQSILAAISQGRQPLLSPGEAMLASLLTPHRQHGLPTCTMHSTINAEIRNHPERLIKMYTQMLRDDQFTFPSGYAVQQQLVESGSITVDLQNGGDGRDAVFKDITGGDPDKVNKQIEIWQRVGIRYTESTDPAEKYKLRLSVHNMNDLLFAHFFQASNFGNGKIDNNGEYGTMAVYAGHRVSSTIYSAPIPVDGSNFLSGIAELKEQAEAQQHLGHCYMRVSTRSSESGHAENIDIAAILALKTDSMVTGRPYPIGDRNYGGRNTSGNLNMSQDIPRLAVRKTNDTSPTFEFGILCGDQFKEKDMEKILVYATDIEVHDVQSWEQIALSAKIRDEILKKSEETLPDFITYQVDPLTRQDIEDAFKRNDTLKEFCSHYSLGEEDQIDGLTPANVQALKSGMLAIFDRVATP